ncbi:MAG: HAMP domain-containing histidine kinase [Chloroflexi bacterium]|nr:HAMP domain-containing histidine kinase [Chloroflexota bacterium]
MIPRSLGGRLVGAFAILALAILLAVGGALFVALRGLHQDATLGGLQDVAGSVIPQVRDSVGSGELRGTLEEVRGQLASRNIELMLIGADGRLRPIGGAPTGAAILTSDLAIGETVKGTVTLDDTRYLYVATGIRRAAAATPKAIAFLAVDRSGALALADLGRTIPIVILVVLLIAAPLAIALSRSVTRPLRRLAAATADIPAGRAQALPESGPKEVRELMGTFNAMGAELDATRRREDELLANLRHDLRTPLTVIAGFAAALRDGTATGPAAEAAAKAIEEESARLERLVAEVGAVERIRSGDEQIRPELLDAGELVAATAIRFGPRAAAAGVSLTTDVDGLGASLGIAADRLALDRMLGNLVENALAATSGRSGTPAVVIAAAAARLPGDIDAIRFTVLDDGPGFPDGTAARAFERFWRADPSRAGAGSGLGLAIVQELAVAHGGIAFAENRAEGGARVGITLPRVPWPTQGGTGR